MFFVTRAVPRSASRRYVGSLLTQHNALGSTSSRLYSSDASASTTPPAAAPDSNTNTQSDAPPAQPNGTNATPVTSSKPVPPKPTTSKPTFKPANVKPVSPAPKNAPLNKPISTDYRNKSTSANGAGKGQSALPYYTAKTITCSPSGAPFELGNNDIDWENSYYGISTRPVTAEQFKVLLEPIPEQDIEVKPDGVIYLPEIKYRRRLNEAFGPMGWGLIPRSEPTLSNGIATREYALIVGGRFVAQAQGENTYFSPDGMPAAVEGCKSNALMRCCKDLGIASELWDPTFIRVFKSTRMQEVWVEHATTKKKRTLWFKKDQVTVAYPWKMT